MTIILTILAWLTLIPAIPFILVMAVWVWWDTTIGCSKNN